MRLFLIFLFLLGLDSLQAEKAPDNTKPKEAPKPRSAPHFEYGDIWVEDPYETPFWGWINGGYSFGETIGLQHGYGNLSLFVAPCMECSIFQPFLDARAHYITREFRAGNFGGGFRLFDFNNDIVWGANIYYDYRKTCVGYHNQVGVGAEFLGSCFELRINTYFPTKGCLSKQHFIISRDIDGEFATPCFTFETPQRGWDFEIGQYLYKYCNFTLWTGFGGYYFKDVNGHKHRLGEKVRATLYWGSFVSLQARICHDNIQNFFTQGVIELSFPLDITDFF